MHPGSFIVDTLLGIADTKTSEGWSLSWRSSGSLAIEKLLMLGGNQDKRVWCQCYHSKEVRLDDKTGRFCPCSSSLYIIFRGDSSILSWFWLPVLILRSIISDSRFSTEFQTNTSNCQQDIPAWVSLSGLSYSTRQESNSFSSLPNLLSNLCVCSPSWTVGCPTEMEQLAQLGRSHGVLWLISLFHFLLYISHQGSSLPSQKRFYVVSSQFIPLVQNLIPFHLCCPRSPITDPSVPASPV